jgi:O-antigen/teichoic acid export membrane protein
LTSIVVSRACGVEQFGYYVLVFTILIHTELVIKSLVSSPFTVFANRFRGGRLARYTANTLIQLVTLASAASGIVLLLTWLLWSAGLGQSLIRPLAALAVAIPFTQLREFARRVAFARLKPTRALALDLAVSVVQLLLLYTLWHLAVLHPGAAYAAIGVACGVVAIPWFLWTQSERRLEPRGCRTDWVRNWKFGKWVLAGLTTHQLTWSAANWIIAAKLGPVENGVYAGCLTVAFLSNPLILGLSNLIGPRCARAFAAEGKSELLRSVWSSMKLYTIGMAVFVAGAVLVGDHVLLFVFNDAAYASRQSVLVIVALAIAILAVAIPAASGLWAMQRPKDVCVASVAGLVVATYTTTVAASHFGLNGAACGLLVGSVIETSATLWLFHRALRLTPDLQRNLS